MKKILILLLCTFVQNIFAQNSGNTWYFGQNAGLNFNTVPPTIITNGALNTNEGCASYSSPTTGLIKLYTDGITVWDKNNNAMPASITTPLFGDPSSTQSGVIVPNPSDTNLFYIFTTPSTAGNIGPSASMCYSTIDLTLNSGNGDVVTANNVLIDTSTEKIAVVGNCDGSIYWVVGHQWNTDTFFAYKITNTGIAPPVKTAIGTIHVDSGSAGNAEAIGYMKFSSDGQKIGLCKYNNANSVELFDFDFNTGVLSNPIFDAIGFDSLLVGDGMYGCSFSPDNNLFYAVYSSFNLDTSKVYQYNLQAGSNAAILASRTVVYTTTDVLGAIQNGPNGKMYIVNNSTNKLDVLDTPNGLGSANVGLTLGVVIYSGLNVLTFGLPNIIENFLSNTGIGQPVKMNYNACWGIDSVVIPSSYSNNSTILWNFGDPSSGAANTSTLVNPTHTYAANGTYTVTAIITGGCAALDTVTATVTIGKLNVKTNKDTTICSNNAVQMNTTVANNPPNLIYTWSPNTTLSCSNCANPIANPTSTTSYIVTASSAACIGKDTVKITVDPGPSIAILNNDTTYCMQSAKISLITNGSNNNISWSPNTALSCNNCSNPIASPFTSTQYIVTATTQNGCSDKDTINLRIIPLNTSLITINDTACQGSAISLVAQIQQPSANPVCNWTLGNGATFNNNTNLFYTYPNIGNYVVNAIIADTLGCMDTLTKNVSVVGQNFAAFIISDSQICVGETIACTDSIGQYSNKWKYDFGDFVILNNIHNPIHVYETPITYIVTLTAENGYCPPAVDSKTLIVSDYPLVNLGNDTSFCTNFNAAFSLKNLANIGGTYLWNDGSVGKNLSVSAAGIYYVTVTNNGCSNADTINIARDCYINIPNVFTPNADGLNNCFFPTNLLTAGLTSFKMRIFNRWGNEVFYTTNLNSKGWDGNYGNKPQPIGTYIYQIDIIMKNGERGSYHGNVTLLR
jgi:gliding motility-associated-like protein